MPYIKRRDGFTGEKLISLPNKVWKHAISLNPILRQLYVTHIGYFPKASFHYRDRRNGCTDNILIYCIRGKGWYMIGNKKFEVGVNQYCIIPATRQHIKYGADEDDPWTIYWVHFSGTAMDIFNKSFRIGFTDGPRSIHFNEEGVELWNSMYKSLEMGYSTENLTSSTLHLYHFIATFLYPGKHLVNKKQRPGDVVHETILFMKSNIALRLTVAELATRHHLSASHFTWLFRKATGMSPLDYFIHLKIQEACLLLQTTNIKVKMVALKLGYEDPYYFSRLFKKYMEVSPDKYRGLG